MKTRMTALAIVIPLFTLLVACERNTHGVGDNTVKLSEPSPDSTFRHGYSTVHGIAMYYEIYGEGKPMVLIHGGGSTIQTSFEKIIPALSKHRQVIAMELQAHGRTADRDQPLSFEQDADDVAALLHNLRVDKADFLGFSNGGNTAMQIAIRHPEIVDKIIVASGFYKRSGMQPGFWEGMKKATIANMPQELKEGFLKVTPDTAKLQTMFHRDVARMLGFKDWDESQLKSIHAPALIVAADADVITPEHAVQMYRLIPHCRLMILPGGHGEYMGEVTFTHTGRNTATFVPLVEEFLND